MLKTANDKARGFTIVELLVVIVIVGILAAIVVTAYSGITQKAIASSLQSDLANASKQLKMFQVENGAYPSSNNCPTPAIGEICLKSSIGNSYGYINVDMLTDNNSQVFCLNAINKNISYNINQDGGPNSGECPLSGWWALNGNANDSSGNERNGSIGGSPALTIGQDGNTNGAYLFNAATQTITTPIPAIKNTILTISAWIKPTSLPMERSTIVQGIFPESYYLSLSNDASLQCYWYGTSPAGYHSSGANSILLNQWSHVLATWSGSDVKLYVNGQLKNTISISGIGYSSTFVVIGAESASRQFRGSIDDVRIYNHSLSAGEALSLYSMGAK